MYCARVHCAGLSFNKLCWFFMFVVVFCWGCLRDYDAVDVVNGLKTPPLSKTLTYLDSFYARLHAS